MIFNAHYELKGLHAFLGASKYHWLNYDDEKIMVSYKKHKAAERGTELHEFADMAIKLKQKLPRVNKTLNMYVNDAIGFKMITEQVLFYSDNCFGTCDSISFRNNILRIHDLKTGESKPYIQQLLIYAALFCLEYKIKPSSISYVLSIYYNNEVFTEEPTGDDILPIMDKIISADKIINRIRLEEI